MAGGSVFQVGKDVDLYEVAVLLNALAICLLVFEAALHHLEHHLLAHNDKYQHMLKKVYRELMILGLLSFIIKMLTEVGGIDGYSGLMLAFQVADLIIFILAITLVLQAITVLLLLRGYNKRADRAELITTQDLVDVLKSSEGSTSWCGKQPNGELVKKEIVKLRLLRHLFLQRFGLPQLFTFSKYLRRAQANTIVHMIEVEPSMWLLLLGMTWAFSAVVRILEDFEVEVRYELIETLLAFAWVLVLLHIVVLLYFRFCVNRLMSIAGYSKDKRVLAENLGIIAEEEARAWQDEAADSALDAMNRIHAEHEEIEHERKAARRGLLKSDAGFQLIATCFRNVPRVFCCKERTAHRPTGVLPGTPDIHLPLFSRKAWHVLVMFMMILNGFFVALLVMGAVYSFDEIYDQVGIFPVIMIPLPLVLNSLFLQKAIFRDYVLICCILRIDASTLGEVVNHFSEIVELRSEFATSLIQCLKERGHSIAELDKALQSHDLRKTGFIDVDKLRSVLANFGFQLTRFRLNSVVKLLFELQGTRVEYAQLIQLVTLIQQEHCVEDGYSGQYPGVQRTMTSFEDIDGQDSTRLNRLHLPLLAQSSLAPEPGPSDFMYVSASTPSVRRLLTFGSNDDNTGRQPMLQRSFTRPLTRLSSRMLHDVYNLQTASQPLGDSTSNTRTLVCGGPTSKSESSFQNFGLGKPDLRHQRLLHLIATVINHREADTERHGSQLKTPSTIRVKHHHHDRKLMKAGVLSVAAACTASMGIAVWKLVIDRPSNDKQSGITTTVNNDKSTAIPSENIASDQQLSVSKLQDTEDSTDWKVGDSRASLLRTIANKVPSKPQDLDWDSDSDTTEWSSIADDDDYRVETRRSWKTNRQRSSRWIHVGHGRYTKCA